MTDKEVKQFEEFSKLVVPPGWEPLLVKDEAGLEWMGLDNLRLLLSDWKVTQRSCETLLKSWEKVEVRSGVSDPRANYHRKMIARAKKAIPIIQKVINKAVPKPVFATHRPFKDSFNVGDKVLVYVPVLDFDSFITGIVMEVTDYECYIASSKEFGYQKINIENRSPLVLKVEDAKYLSMNPSYLGLFVGMSGIMDKDDMSDYADMIFDARKKYFPETLEVHSESLPQGVILDEDPNTSE